MEYTDSWQRACDQQGVGQFMSIGQVLAQPGSTGSVTRDLEWLHGAQTNVLILPRSG
jgi:hypothetical protein